MSYTLHLLPRQLGNTDYDPCVPIRKLVSRSESNPIRDHLTKT
jgi:hypothetical protein